MAVFLDEVSNSSDSFELTVFVVMSNTELLYSSPTKCGEYYAYSAFLPTEPRFKWQNAVQTCTDGITITLPSTIGKGPCAGFGTSTREDWDTTRKNRMLCPGPGSYTYDDSHGKQLLSERTSCATASFAVASRSTPQSGVTPSPGPIYSLPKTLGSSSTRATKFSTAKREPLHGKSQNTELGSAVGRTNSAGSGIVGRSSANGPIITFGSEKRMRHNRATDSVPGPIYNLDLTGYKTGGALSFTRDKRFGKQHGR